LAASLLLCHGEAGGSAPSALAADATTCAVSASLGPAGCTALLHRLARIADEAYGDAPTATPPSDFHAADIPGVSLRAGRYRNGSASALVMTAELDHAPVLVVGFGGSDDPSTWLADLRDINAPYDQFRPLIAAVEAYAAAGRRVVLVGHSFGGAMVQLFMFAHAGDDNYRAVTFGSPGALPQPGVFAVQADPRIANLVIADDPYVFLGEHRAEVAAYARRNRIFAFALAGGIAQESGLSLAEIVGSEPYLTANYVNNGAKIVLSRDRPGLSVATVIGADSDEHEIGTYAARLGSGSG
jgi:pimeloyl-ACP methyl ester carboxylesterase